MIFGDFWSILERFWDPKIDEKTSQSCGKNWQGIRHWFSAQFWIVSGSNIRSLTQFFTSVNGIVWAACEHCEMSKTTVKYNSFNRFWAIRRKRSRKLVMPWACKRTSRFALRLRNFLRGGFDVILQAIWGTNLGWFASIFWHWFWGWERGGVGGWYQSKPMKVSGRP